MGSWRCADMVTTENAKMVLNLDVEPAGTPPSQQVLGSESGQVNLREGGRPDEHLLGASTEGPRGDCPAPRWSKTSPRGRTSSFVTNAWRR